MRFDDVLGTVRTIDLSTPAAAQAAWRQIVDLVGRRRAPADEWALSTLAAIRDRVPVAARAASARALFGAQPPAALVRVLATDDIAVGAPVLRAAELSDAEWTDLLPALAPAARAILRHRRDLSAGVQRALESFGSVDFVLSGEVAPAEAPLALQPEPEPEPENVAVPAPVESGPFQTLGTIARTLPVVAEALRRENDNEAPAAEGDVFRIADVVARIEAFQKRKGDAPRVSAVPANLPEQFRFETDATGVLRWAEGMPRDAILGLSLARAAAPGGAGVDGSAAGAFRRRARFGDAHLVVGGSGPAAGRWLMTAMPVFDPPTGRFTGYRGSARRPLSHELPARPAAVAPAGPSADSLRQLVHELRTPTNAIAGFSEMIECEMLGPVEDVYRGQAATMREDAHRLLSAIDDVDVAARVAGGALSLSPQPIELAPLVARLAGDLHLLAESRGAVVEVDADPLVAMADPGALERGISRLLGAAIGAAALGETILVRAEDTGGGRIALSVTRPRAFDAHPGDAILSVDDEDSPATLLGVGFSLRLVRNLARALGGALDLDTRTRVRHLPAAIDDTIGHTASS